MKKIFLEKTFPFFPQGVKGGAEKKERNESGNIRSQARDHFLQWLHKILEVDVYDRKFDIFLLHSITESGIVIVFIHFPPKLIIRIKPQRKIIQERKKERTH